VTKLSCRYRRWYTCCGWRPTAAAAAAAAAFYAAILMTPTPLFLYTLRRLSIRLSVCVSVSLLFCLSRSHPGSDIEYRAPTFPAYNALPRARRRLAHHIDRAVLPMSVRRLFIIIIIIITLYRRSHSKVKCQITRSGSHRRIRKVLGRCLKTECFVQR